MSAAEVFFRLLTIVLFLYRQTNSPKKAAKINCKKSQAMFDTKSCEVVL